MLWSGKPRQGDTMWKWALRGCPSRCCTCKPHTFWKAQRVYVWKPSGIHKSVNIWFKGWRYVQKCFDGKYSSYAQCYFVKWSLGKSSKSYGKCPIPICYVEKLFCSRHSWFASFLSNTWGFCTTLEKCHSQKVFTQSSSRTISFSSRLSANPKPSHPVTSMSWLFPIFKNPGPKSKTV